MWSQKRSMCPAASHGKSSQAESGAVVSTRCDTGSEGPVFPGLETSLAAAPTRSPSSRLGSLSDAGSLEIVLGVRRDYLPGALSHQMSVNLPLSSSVSRFGNHGSHHNTTFGSASLAILNRCKLRREWLSGSSGRSLELTPR